MKTHINNNPIYNFAKLSSMCRAELAEVWQSVYGTALPRNMSQQLILRALSYRVQELAQGGLKPRLRTQLMNIAETGVAARSLNLASMRVKPGTRLLREWHGISHEVMVLENGVRYQGQRYRSLSQVATKITGAKWSGPLFFGLKKEAA